MNVSVLVNSCDKYEKIWPTFFEMFNKFWPDCKYQIFLNTESKNYEPKGFKLKMLHSQNQNQPWSARLMKALKHIDTPYVLMMLDDFIFEESVNTNVLNMCVERMEKDKTIGVLQFVVGNGSHGKSECYPEWEEQHKKDEYRINCQISLWNKAYLLKILRSFESPWEFEKYGSIRSRRYPEKVYAWANEENYVFTYNWGKPIIGGKWNLDEVDRLEEKLGIRFDLSGRESMRNYYENLNRNPKPKRDIFWLLKKMKHIKSLF